MNCPKCGGSDIFDFLAMMYYCRSCGTYFNDRGVQTTPREKRGHPPKPNLIRCYEGRKK